MTERRDGGGIVRVSQKQISEAIANFAILEAQSRGSSAQGLWNDHIDVMALVIAYAKQKEREGYLRGLKEGIR